MSRILIVAGLLVAASSTSYNTAYALGASVGSAPPQQQLSQCALPISFMCTSDVGHSMAGPAPAPYAARPAADGSSSSSPSSSSSASSIWETLSSVSSWVTDSIFGSPNAASAAIGSSGAYRRAKSSYNLAAEEKKAAFYASADSGEECYAISGELAATTTAHPDPQLMTVSQREASYFHVFCGDVTEFHGKADQFVSERLWVNGLDAQSTTPVLAKGDVASEKGFFPKFPAASSEAAAAKSSSNVSGSGSSSGGAPEPTTVFDTPAAKKLRNTALIIVPGGSYARLSFYEAMVFPMEIINQQLRGQLQTTTNSSSSASSSSLGPNDFVPIVLQYRVTPTSPDGPMEDISKVVRMLERYRQKRLVASLSNSDNGDGGNGNAEEGGEGKPTTDAADDSNLGAGGFANGGDFNYDSFGSSDFESKLQRDASAQKRLSPAMLGLTDDFKIMIVGFSAGGHAVASYSAMASTIPIAASLLVFPVVSMEDASIAHYQSTMNLLNVEPNMTEVENPMVPISAEKNVSSVGARRGFLSANSEGDADAPVVVDAEMPPNAAAAEADSPHADSDDSHRLVAGPGAAAAMKGDSAAEALEVAYERYLQQRALQHRYSPNNFPNNFPQCVYMAHTQTDPVVSARHSELLFRSLVRHRRAEEVKRRTLELIQRRQQREEEQRRLRAADKGERKEREAAGGEFNINELRSPTVRLPPVVVRMTDPSVSPPRDIGNLSLSYNVGFRSYPKGPHGRWWLNAQAGGLPELGDWWSEVLSFLENNNC